MGTKYNFSLESKITCQEANEKDEEKEGGE